MERSHWLFLALGVAAGTLIGAEAERGSRELIKMGACTAAVRAAEDYRTSSTARLDALGKRVDGALADAEEKLARCK